MNILFFSHNNNEKSGANKSLLSILNQLKKNHNLIVVVNKTPGNLSQEIEKLGIQVKEFNYGWNCLQFRKGFVRRMMVFVREVLRNSQMIFQLKELKKLCEDNRIDVIYSNTSVINVGAILSLLTKIPHVWHIREFREQDFNFKLLTPFRIQQRLFEHSFKNIYISQILKDHYENKYSLNNGKVIYNGFEINDYKFDKINRIKEEINVLICGQISEKKGQGVAIGAINQLRDKYPHLHLYIAGSGDDKYLKQELSKYSYNSNIHLLGQVDNIYELRKKMHIEVVCSKSEAFGRVVIEAMLHHLPVIGPNSGAVKELIKDSENGMLFDLKSHNLSFKIQELIESEDLRRRIAQEGHNYALSFTIEKTVSKISEILKNIESLNVSFKI